MSREIGVRGAEILPAAATVRARARVRRRRRRGRGGEAAIAADGPRCFRSPGWTGRLVGGELVPVALVWRRMGLDAVVKFSRTKSSREVEWLTGFRWVWGSLTIQSPILTARVYRFSTFSFLKL